MSRSKAAVPPLDTADYEMVARLAQGETKQAVARALGVPLTRIRNRARIPAVVELVHEYRQRFIRRLAERLADDLAADAPTNLRFLQQVRDGAIRAEPAMLRLRLQAASTLFAYQFPKRTEQTEDKTLRFVLERGEQDRIEQVLTEAQAVTTTTGAPAG